MEAPKAKTNPAVQDLAEAKAAETHMVAPAPKQKKMVKIRALREIKVGPTLYKPAQIDATGAIIKEADVVEVSEDEAAEFCKPIQGPFGFSGERPTNESVRHQIKRAELVKESA